MLSLIAAVRAVFPGALTASSTGSTLGAITWWPALDYIGHSAYWPLGSPALIGVPPSPDVLAAAWQQWLPQIEAVANASGRTVLLTSVGYQSRPNCHCTPWGTGKAGQGNDQGDTSAWPVAYDLMCQVRRSRINAEGGAFCAADPRASHPRRRCRLTHTRPSSAPSRRSPGLQARTSGSGASTRRPAAPRITTGRRTASRRRQC